MSEKILVPVLGESISEATVAKWLKSKGDKVKMDEAIVELETDKVNLEVPSPIDGVLSEINAKDGQVVQVGSTLGSISQGTSKSSEQKIVKIKSQKEEKEIKNDQIFEKKSQKLFNNKVIKLEKSVELKKNNNEEPLILNKEVQFKSSKGQVLSPAVRKIVEENKIDVKQIEGSGKEGRILKSDLIELSFSQHKSSTQIIQ